MDFRKSVSGGDRLWTFGFVEIARNAFRVFGAGGFVCGRINEYRKKIEALNSDWCRASFEKAPWQTASYLLSLRDTLIEAGWNGESGNTSERFDFFERIERLDAPLAPLFDVNPMPEHVKGHTLSMDIVEGDNTASLELLCEQAELFYIRQGKARSMLLPIAHAVSGWRSIATSLGISGSQQNEMAGAFEHAAGYGSVLNS